MVFTDLHAQELKVTYNNRVLIDSTQLEKADRKIREILFASAKGEDYELMIYNGISLYEPLTLIEDKSINTSSTNSMTNYNYYETIFNDYNRKERTSSIKYSGETFLIAEKLEPIDWQIMQETKKIDSYNVKRAEAVVDGNNVTVWFTDDIPVSAGPSNFFGLPGLILQAQFGKRLITAKKIEPLTGSISLVPPVKGKKYSRKEYNDLINAENNVKEGTTRNGNTTTTVTRN